MCALPNPLTALVGELASAIPEFGIPLSGVIAYFDARANELRLRQLEAYIQDLHQRVEALGADKLNRAWLGSEEGQRVVLGLGEAALDLLRADKVRLLAGAAVASAKLDSPAASNRRRFAQIVIDADLDVLTALYVLAVEFGQRDRSWQIRFEIYARQLATNNRPVRFPAEVTAVLDEFVLRDAVTALERYRLADMRVSSESISSIRPRPIWRQFAGYLLDATSDPEHFDRDA